MSALITPAAKTLVQRVLNAAETGTPDGAYHDVTILRDGKGGTRQITYGKSQTTEQGNLAKLIRLYCDKGGKYAAQFQSYHPAIGVKPLVNDSVFKDLLRRGGKEDPVMKQAQDEFFDEVYWQPAFEWFNKNGFTLPLSMLVIYDSYIHSGRILDSLRKRFAEPRPYHLATPTSLASRADSQGFTSLVVGFCRHLLPISANYANVRACRGHSCV